MTSYYLTEEARLRREQKLVERVADELTRGIWLPDSDYWRLPVRLQRRVVLKLVWRRCVARLKARRELVLFDEASDVLTPAKFDYAVRSFGQQRGLTEELDAP